MRNIFGIVVVGILAVIALGAGPDCDQIFATGFTEQDSSGCFWGMADVYFRNTDEMRVARVMTCMTGEPKETGCGALIAPTMHVFDFGNGDTVTTSDRAMLHPVRMDPMPDEPFLFRMKTKMRVDSGTGLYENACGHLMVHGTIDLAGVTHPSGAPGPPYADWSAKGMACICE